MLPARYAEFSDAMIMLLGLAAVNYLTHSVTRLTGIHRTWIHPVNYYLTHWLARNPFRPVTLRRVSATQT